MPGGMNPPPELVASWPRPNYVDPPTQGNGLEVLCIFLPIVATALVAARMYARLIITRAAGLDDILIVVALAISFGLSALIILDVQKMKIDRHIWDIPPRLQAPNGLYQFCGQLLWVAITGIIKTSILLYYRRLSGPFSSKFRIASMVGIAYNIICIVVFYCFLMLECRPTKAFWMRHDLQWKATGHKYECPIAEKQLLPYSGILSVIGDAYSTLLPLCLVYSLQMPRKQKQSLYILFAFGFLVVGAGLARTVILEYLFNHTYDSSWWTYKAWVWSIIELYLAIVVASAPALKPFFRKYLISPISTFHASRTGTQGGNITGNRPSVACGPPFASSYMVQNYSYRGTMSPLAMSPASVAWSSHQSSLVNETASTVQVKVDKERTWA